MQLLLKFSLFIALINYSLLAFSEQSLAITLYDDTELEVQVYKASGHNLILIMPSEYGITDGLNNLAVDLQSSGVEVWIADPFSSWMLPVVESSLSKIPNAAYVELIRTAQQYGQANDKRIYLLSHDKGSGKLLESVREWQLSSDNIVSGLILISPNLYSKTPDVGNEGELLPITYATNLPLFLYVPEKSTLALRIRNIVNALETGGSDVFVKKLAHVRDRFFFRPDAAASENNAASSLSQEIMQSLKLTRTYAKPRKAATLLSAGENDTKSSPLNKTTGTLRIYHGSLKPEDFKLKDLNDKTHRLSDYRGKVVLVNFWASWCPPCVHEIPSMSVLNSSFNSSLKDDLIDQPFKILAINLGEPKKDIIAFIDSHPVNFPVLLDPQQALPRQWKVFAFPTSYLIDKQGNIRYSVAGAIDWGSNDVEATINRLISE